MIVPGWRIQIPANHEARSLEATRGTNVVAMIVLGTVRESDRTDRLDLARCQAALQKLQVISETCNLVAIDLLSHRQVIRASDTWDFVVSCHVVLPDVLLIVNCRLQKAVSHQKTSNKGHLSLSQSILPRRLSHNQPGCLVVSQTTMTTGMWSLDFIQ